MDCVYVLRVPGPVETLVYIQFVRFVFRAQASAGIVAAHKYILCVSGARVCARRYAKVIPLLLSENWMKWFHLYFTYLFCVCVNTIRYLIFWLSGSMSHDLRDDFNLFLLLRWWR